MEILAHRYIGIHFSARQIRIILLISSPPTPSDTRVQLAREVCSRFNLHQPNGKMRTVTVAVDILKRMDMDNMIALPAFHRIAPIGPAHPTGSSDGSWRNLGSRPARP